MLTEMDDSSKQKALCGEWARGWQRRPGYEAKACSAAARFMTVQLFGGPAISTEFSQQPEAVWTKGQELKTFTGFPHRP